MIEFSGDNVDPHRFWKKYDEGIVFVAIYMDDSLIVSNPETMDNTIKLLKQQRFVLKVEDDLNDYLSCEIHFIANRKKAQLGQPHLLANLEKKFANDVQQMRSTNTTETLNFGIVFPTNDNKMFSAEDQKQYDLNVGMLLYLVKTFRNYPKSLIELTKQNTRKFIELANMLLRLKIKPIQGSN